MLPNKIVAKQKFTTLENGPNKNLQLFKTPKLHAGGKTSTMSSPRKPTKKITHLVNVIENEKNHNGPNQKNDPVFIKFGPANKNAHEKNRRITTVQ